MHAYIIGCEIEPIEVGVVYPYFPLHCTLIHWFLTDVTPEEIDQKIRPIIENADQFTIESSAPALYGDNNDIPVHTIVPNPNLTTLHTTLLAALAFSQPKYTIPHLGDAYGPHVTTVEGRQFTTGNTALIKEIYLAEAVDHQSMADRTAVYKYQLT